MLRLPVILIVAAAVTAVATAPPRLIASSGRSSLKTDDDGRGSAASTAAPRPLPLLFMSPDDLVGPWGKQTLVAPDSEDVTDRVCPAADCDLTHDGLQKMMVGGMMAPNPLRPEAGVEIFFSAPCELDVYNATAPVLPGWDKSVYFMTTRDFVTYSPAVRVASINRFVISPAWNKTFLSPHSCMAKSIARSHSGSKYVILSICADEGIRPMVADGPLALDSFTAQPLMPAFWDHDVFIAAFSATGSDVIDFQITFQSQNSTPGWSGRGLKYCDNVGLANCEEGFRRVVTMRTSQDGLTWSNRAACPGEVWGPNQTGEVFSSQFRHCAAGWNQHGMITPVVPTKFSINQGDASDPPDLEFYQLTPMFVGNTTRVVGHALLYAPAPLQDLGYHYGLQPPLGPRNKSSGRVDLRQAHGPMIGIERWIGPADGNLSSQPMATAWQRPFRSQTKKYGTGFGEGGILFRDWHVWYYKTERALLGIPAYRLAGVRSMANSEFSTLTFEVPTTPLWVNADVSWASDPQNSVTTCYGGCAAYLMVAVLDASNDETLPGYEHSRCVMMNVSSTRLALVWQGAGPLHEQHAGRLVRLRMFYREATIFAVGTSEHSPQHAFSLKNDDGVVSSLQRGQQGRQRHGFYLLFAPMLDGPEWPHAYEMYRDGIIILYPFNVTAQTTQRIKDDLNATVLMYFDTQDIAIETSGLCVNQANTACNPRRPCSTGRVMCCYDYNCTVFSPNSTATFCPESDFQRALKAVFPASWAINLLPHLNGSVVTKPTPICFYYFGPLYAHSARSVDALSTFVTSWVHQHGYDGLYLDLFAAVDRPFTVPEQLGTQPFDSDGDGRPNTIASLQKQAKEFRPVWSASLRRKLGAKAVMLGNAEGNVVDRNLNGLTLEMEHCTPPLGNATACVQKFAKQREVSVQPAVSIVWLTHSEILPAKQQCETVAAIQKALGRQVVVRYTGLAS